MRYALLLLLAPLPALAAPWPTAPDPAPWSRLETGVEVQDVAVGTGAEVTEGAVAHVLYTGMLQDGTVFDSNVESGQLLSFRVGARKVIRGWEDGLVGMKVGGTRRLVIPPSEGYGSRAVGPIPPDSTLYFEVTLQSVEAPRTSPQAPTDVPEDAWRALEGGVFYTDLTPGKGPRAKPGGRVCLDYAVFKDGARVEHTFARERCTWYRLADDDLPAALDLGMTRMREGGTRQIRASDGTVYVVQLTATGK